MDNPVDGTDGKLGRGFMSADKLEEVDIGNGDKPRPTFISANLELDFRKGLIKLLKEYKDCFAWIIRRCLVWTVPSLSIGCQSNLVLTVQATAPENLQRRSIGRCEERS
jgi:hypothetical protein